MLTSLHPITAQPASGSTPGITTIYKTKGLPASLKEPFIDYHGQLLPLTDESAVICRVIHFPPLNPEQGIQNYVHRTQSVDFGVVLEGEIQLILDNHEKTILREGDIVVQRGTVHVRSSYKCRAAK